MITVEPDFIATEMSAFPSNSSRNKCDIDPVNEKTTLIKGIMGVISIVSSDDSDHFSSLFSRPLDRCYQIRFYSSNVTIAIL